jgi:hypothetical protein
MYALEQMGRFHIVDLLLDACVTLDKTLPPAQPQCPLLCNKEIMFPTSQDQCNELIHMKALE